MDLRKLLIAGILFISFGCSAQQHARVMKKGSRFVIELTGQYLELDPQNGGRITALNMGSQSFLTDSTVNAFNWGSTFWPSPQSDWNWPPPAQWDNQPYAAELKNNEVTMTGRPDPKTGLAVTKIFSGDRRNNSYTLTYIITNHSQTPQKVAPWEVTRVHTGGFSFFPIGKSDKRGGLLPSVSEKDGVCWYVYNHDSIPSEGDTQLYTDGSEGWFCQVNGRLMLIKKFPDISPNAAASKEAEVELYANKAAPGKSYVEVEQQGAYETLQPGGSLTWRMQWLFRKIPANLKPVPFNNGLVDFARRLTK